MRYLVPVTLFVTLFVALAACSSGKAKPTPTQFALQGSVNAAPTGDGTPACETYHLNNAAVTVKNESGTILAAATTGTNARPVPTDPPTEEDPPYKVKADPVLYAKAIQDSAAFTKAYNSCRVTFTTTVPRAQFYQLTIGTHGAPTYSFDQMQQMGWKIDLSLGQ